MVFWNLLYGCPWTFLEIIPKNNYLMSFLIPTSFLPFLITTSIFITTTLFSKSAPYLQKVKNETNHVNLEHFGTCNKENCGLWLVILVTNLSCIFLIPYHKTRYKWHKLGKNTLSWIVQGEGKRMSKDVPLPFEAHTDSSSARYELHLIFHLGKICLSYLVISLVAIHFKSVA